MGKTKKPASSRLSYPREELRPRPRPRVAIHGLNYANDPDGVKERTVEISREISARVQRCSCSPYQSLAYIIRRLILLVSRNPSLWDCPTTSESGLQNHLSALYELLTQIRDELLKISGRAKITACFTRAQDEARMKILTDKLANSYRQLENMPTRRHVDSQEYESAKSVIFQQAVQPATSSPVMLGSLEVKVLNLIDLPSSLRIKIEDNTMMIPVTSSDPLLNVLHKPLWCCLPDRDCGELKKHLGTLLVRVAHGCHRLPSALMIDTVQLRSRHHVDGGGYADIYQGMLDGKLVALKRFRVYSPKEQETLRQRFCKEVVLWQYLNHRNVLPFYGLDECSFRPFLCMISPWMNNGNILEHTVRHNLSGSAVNLLLSHAIDGLEYLHNVGMVHGDLRCANIFVSDDDEACLADFGLATLITDSAGLGATSSQGSHRWNAPELYDPDFKRRTVYTDIYAFGATCLELHTREPPFAEKRIEMAVACAIMRGERPTWPSSAQSPRIDVSEELRSVVEQCWGRDPIHRPAVGDIKDILSRLCQV